MVSFLPTVWPHERQKNRKSNSTVTKEKLDENSTDIWTKSIVQRYEERPSEMDAIYLVEFVAWYTETRSSANSKRNKNDDTLGDEPNDTFEDDVNFHEETSMSTATIGNTGTRYSKRKVPRVIRYRNYELDDIINYKREMVMLYLPFRNEIVNVIDRYKFEGIYNENEVLIMERRKLYESNINIEQVIAEIKALCDQSDDFLPVDTRDEFVRSVLLEGHVENNDDIEAVNTNCGISAIRQRENVMSKHDYCEMLRITDREQRELILEVIHRLHSPEDNTKPIQIFFTGLAGCGKTYALKALMETYNRFTQKHNSMSNAYVACASTGKAAVNLGGTTVHSAFRITQSRQTSHDGSRGTAELQKHVCWRKVRYNRRGEHDRFRCLDIIFCDDSCLP